MIVIYDQAYKLAYELAYDCSFIVLATVITIVKIYSTGHKSVPHDRNLRL